MTPNKTRADLEALERRGWDSLCDGTGADFYGAEMTEDGLMVLADGSVMDRDAVVAALKDAPTWQRYELENVRLVPIDDGSAALVYTGTAHRDGGDPVVAVMSSVYRRDGDNWKLALYQQTPIPGA